MIKTIHIHQVAGIEFPDLERAKAFAQFLQSLRGTPYQVFPPSEDGPDADAEDCSAELEHRIGARAVIETLRYFVNVPSYAKPWQVWDAALQAGFSPKPPPGAKKKVIQTPTADTAPAVKLPPKKKGYSPRPFIDSSDWP